MYKFQLGFYVVLKLLYILFDIFCKNIQIKLHLQSQPPNRISIQPPLFTIKPITAFLSGFFTRYNNPSPHAFTPYLQYVPMEYHHKGKRIRIVDLGGLTHEIRTVLDQTTLTTRI